MRKRDVDEWRASPVSGKHGAVKNEPPRFPRRLFYLSPANKTLFPGNGNPPPVGRLTIVAAKLTVSAIWFVAMASIVYAEALIVGFLIDLPGYAPGLLHSNAQLAAKLALQVFLISSITAWITVASRGYLAPVGFSILLLLIGDLFAHTGWGVWIPWSIILLTTGAGGPEGMVPGAASMGVLVASFAAGILATYLTIESTDNTQ